MTIIKIGDYTIRSETQGFGVYKNAVRVASIGFSGNEGLQQALSEVKRRQTASTSIIGRILSLGR